MNDWNTSIIEQFRANKGVVGGPFEGKHLLIVHAVGRKSGKESLVPLLYAQDGDAYLLCGSLGGAPNDPVWVANLEAMSEATVELPGDRTITAKPTVLRDGPERDRLYELLVKEWPAYRDDYEKKTDRVFPVVRLDPIA